MKILFIGTVKSSLKQLSLLIKLKQNIVGVVTLKESKFHSDYANLTPLCKQNNIDVLYPKKTINDDDCLRWINEKNPDIIFAFGWSQIIKKELLNIPAQGVIGYHPAELPKNRGRHPIIWALVLGLNSTASTFFKMDDGADSGDIISQKLINVTKEDTAQTLYSKIEKVSIKQIKDFLPKLASGKIKLIKQDHSKSNYWRKRSIKDGEIDFRMSSKTVFNLVRALTTPYVGAHIVINSKEIKVWQVEEVFNIDENLEPGKIIKINKQTGEVIVKCGENAIKIIKSEIHLNELDRKYLNI